MEKKSNCPNRQEIVDKVFFDAPRDMPLGQKIDKIIDKIELWHQSQSTADGERLKALIAKYQERITVIKSRIKATDWNNDLQEIEIDTLEVVIDDLNNILNTPNNEQAK